MLATISYLKNYLTNESVPLVFNINTIEYSQRQFLTIKNVIISLS